MGKIDHIGIAVKSLSEALSAWIAVLGHNPSGEETVPEEGVRVAFFDSGPTRIELLEPTSDDSSLAGFVQRRGPGLHHICLSVADLDAALSRARSAGLRPIPPEIRSGAGGRRVAFLHPREVGGVLIELSEDKPTGGTNLDGGSSTSD